MKQIFQWLCMAAVALPMALFAQPEYSEIEVPFIVNGEAIEHPNGGGFNNPIFSMGDMNNDGTEELVVFEKSNPERAYNRKLYIFKNQGTAGNVDYKYAPELTPEMAKEDTPIVFYYFALIRDYNCDSIPDLFVGHTNGIAVYEGSYSPDNTIQFSRTFRLLYYGQKENIFVDDGKLPSIVDVNGDGDLDILVFTQTGSVVSYYENLREEESLTCKQMKYKLVTNCWGKFCECTRGGDLVKYDFLNTQNPFTAETLGNITATDIIKSSPINDYPIYGSTYCTGNVWHSYGYPVQNVGANQYLEFNIEVDSGYYLSMANLLITGTSIDNCDIDSVEIRSSWDNFQKRVAKVEWFPQNGTCKTLMFNLYNQFYEVDDSVTFRIYPFGGSNCPSVDKEFLVSQIVVSGSIFHRSRFDVEIAYSHGFCFYNYLKMPNGDGPVKGGQPNIAGPRHFGASSILAFDRNKDGRLDALISDDSYSSMAYVENSGQHVKEDSMVAFEYFFPQYDKALFLPTYPVGSYIDINDDSKNDLVFAPSYTNPCDINVALDTAANVNNLWYYRNTGFLEDSFSFVTNRFIDMFDVGEGAVPVFFDYNADGLLDLVFGRCFYYDEEGDFSQGLALYENTGTAAIPEYTWVDNDWLGLSSLKKCALHPTFGDLDNDGDEDLLLGEVSGKFIYLENTAGPGNPAGFNLISTNFQNINIGSGYSAPQLVDVNKDGLLDIVTGEIQGRLFYYENIGTASNPAFQKNTGNPGDAWGYVDTRTAGNLEGFSKPFLFDFDEDGHLEAMVGSASGGVHYYDKIESSISSGYFSRLDTAFYGNKYGAKTSVATANINNSTSNEILIGNYKGGVQMLTLESVGIEEPDFHPEIIAYPNPADRQLIIQIEDMQNLSYEVTITDLLGKVHLQFNSGNEFKFQIDTGHLPAGIYIVTVRNDRFKVEKKVVIQH